MCALNVYKLYHTMHFTDIAHTPTYTCSITKRNIFLFMQSGIDSKKGGKITLKLEMDVWDHKGECWTG